MTWLVYNILSSMVYQILTSNQETTWLSNTFSTPPFQPTTGPRCCAETPPASASWSNARRAFVGSRWMSLLPVVTGVAKDFTGWVCDGLGLHFWMIRGKYVVVCQVRWLFLCFWWSFDGFIVMCFHLWKETVITRALFQDWTKYIYDKISCFTVVLWCFVLC